MDAAEDLLQRAAWDYRAVLGQTRQLAEIVEEQILRIEELELQVASLEAAAAARRDPDELAHRLLASAHRSAREELQEARRESELLLKKAERRAEKIEQDARRRLEGEMSQLERLDAAREELCASLRSTLAAIAALGAEGPLPPEVADPPRFEGR